MSFQLYRNAQPQRDKDIFPNYFAPLRLCVSFLAAYPNNLFPFFIFVHACLFSSEPWGKDADLAVFKESPCMSIAPCSTPMLGKFAEAMIRFHQEIISPADGPRSHFIPSSSQYTLNAMRKYGFFRGFTMGCDRLMRENKDPWIYRTIYDGAGEITKFDPVP